MNSMNEWLPISRVSEKVNIPPETVRRYARKYTEFLTLKRGERNAYLLHVSSFDIIIKIRYLLEQGHQHEQVKAMLAGTGGAPEVRAEVAADVGAVAVVDPPVLYKEMMGEIRKLAEQNEQLITALDHVHERLNGYEELVMQMSAGGDIGRRDEERKRDEYLMRTMNLMQEKKKGGKKRGVWARLFVR